MREDLVEVMVKRKTSLGLSALMVLFYIICGGCLLLLVLGLGAAALFFAIIFGIVGFICGHYSKVEYEYTYCNKELDVDAIYQQTTRRSQMSLDLSKMEALVRVEGSKMKEYSNRNCKVLNYTSKKKENKKDVYALFYDGQLEILIEPGDKLLDAISYLYPRKVFKD